MSFGEHLDILRKMLMRIITVALVLMVIIFCFKDETFSLLLAPSSSDFVLYGWLEQLISLCGFSYHFEPFQIHMIATELTSQFMTHISTSAYLALILSSPYILYELFGFISPALYEKERKYSVRLVFAVYLLFVIGILMTYFVLFPISVRFLATYQVSELVVSTITLDSYISTFATLTLLMAVVFQLPVITFTLAKAGIVNYRLLSHYRKHAFLIIMIIAAIITPPDAMTLIIVTIPIYLLYELSVLIVRRVNY